MRNSSFEVNARGAKRLSERLLELQQIPGMSSVRHDEDDVSNVNDSGDNALEVFLSCV